MNKHFIDPKWIRIVSDAGLKAIIESGDYEMREDRLNKYIIHRGQLYVVETKNE